MKNKGLIITLIISLVIIIAALIGFLVLCLNGTISLKNFRVTANRRKTENVIYNETYNIADINNIEINYDAGNIYFENNNENVLKAEVHGENKDEVELSLKDKKLLIDYKNKSYGFFSDNVYGDLIISIPSNFAGKITIKNDAGEISIKDLEEADLDIKCDAGNVKAGKIKNITAKCDAGNLQIDTILEQCDIKLDCGSLDIKKLDIKKYSKIKADMGNIRIRETNDIYIDADTDMSNNQIAKNNKNSEVTLKIDCDMGNVSIK